MLKIIKNKFYTGIKSALFSTDYTSQIPAFHQQIDSYEPTPLVSLPLLAERLGIKSILIKDKSHYFSLKAYEKLVSLML